MDRFVAQGVAAETMRRCAEKLGLGGVGGILVLESWETVLQPTIVIVGDCVPFGRDLEEYTEDNNPAAKAFRKFAEMLYTGVNSGSPQIKGTRSERFGGLVSVVGRTLFISFFDGGTELQNAEIALAALDTLRDVFNARLPKPYLSD